jgi:hypothetical protein
VPHSFTPTNERPEYFCGWVTAAMNIQVLTCNNQPFVSIYCKCGKYLYKWRADRRTKSPGTDQTLAEIIQAGGNTVHFDVHKFIKSILNKIQLSQ